MAVSVIVGAVAALCLCEARATAQEPSSPTPPRSDAERETFLLEGEIVRDQAIPRGITHPRRVTLRRGGYEHDAAVQTHEEYESQVRLESHLEIDFRDSWRNNVAAYRLDRLLGLGFVPVTVTRDYRREPAAWTWWVDGLLMSERDRYERHAPPAHPLDWVCQRQVVRLFDQLIYNFDRSLENLLIDEDWKIWMIDHTRSFKVLEELKDEEGLPTRCERHALAALRRLDRPTLEETMEDLLSDQQISALVARRNRIVAFYDDAIAARGEAAVLYDLPSRRLSAAGSAE
jgi:hypothetical protein